MLNLNVEEKKIVVAGGRWFTRAEWLPCWIGFLGFAVISVSNHLEWTIDPQFKLWDYNPFLAFDDASLWVLPLVFLFMLVTLHFALLISQCENVSQFRYGFILIWICALFAKVLAHQSKMHMAGDSLWAMLLGLLISNVIFCNRDIPDWLKVAQQTELYIATSLVLLLIDFDQLGQLGARSFGVTWIDTPLLMLLMTSVGWKCFRYALPDSVILCATTLVCGSSAAIAMASALSVGKSHSDIPIAISSCLTMPVIVGLPFLARSLGFSDYQAGAWFGGCVDSTGAVLATAHVLNSDDVTSASAVIKMTQNILIAPFSVIVTFLVSKYPDWFFPDGERLLAPDRAPKAYQVLWTRFPKFVLGFLFVSVLFNVSVPEEERTTCKDAAFTLSEWFSTCSFVSIGLNLRFREFPSQICNFILFYLLVQSLDIAITAFLAILFFQ